MEGLAASLVMTTPGAGIHVLLYLLRQKTGMAGTSPALTAWFRAQIFAAVSPARASGGVATDRCTKFPPIVSHCFYQ
jgi:hypothetical protein